MKKDDKRHYNSGGERPGAGRPLSENPKKKLISFRVDTDIEDFIVNMKNRSKYINSLIRKDKDSM
jgi:hypothetical protein